MLRLLCSVLAVYPNFPEKWMTAFPPSYQRQHPACHTCGQGHLLSALGTLAPAPAGSRHQPRTQCVDSEGKHGGQAPSGTGLDPGRKTLTSSEGGRGKQLSPRSATNTPLKSVLHKPSQSPAHVSTGAEARAERMAVFGVARRHPAPDMKARQSTLAGTQRTATL